MLENNLHFVISLTEKVGSPGDGDRREKFVAHQAASRRFEIASNHDPGVKKVSKNTSCYSKKCMINKLTHLLM